MIAWFLVGLIVGATIGFVVGLLWDDFVDIHD